MKTKSQIKGEMKDNIINIENKNLEKNLKKNPFQNISSNISSEVENKIRKRYYVYVLSIITYIITYSFFSLYIYKSIVQFIIFSYLLLAIYLLYLAYDYISLSYSQNKVKSIEKELKEIKKEYVMGKLEDIDFQREEAVLEHKKIKNEINILLRSMELKYLTTIKILQFFYIKSFIKEILSLPTSPQNITQKEIIHQLILNSPLTKKKSKIKYKNKKYLKKKIAELEEARTIIKEILLPKTEELAKLKESSLLKRIERIKHKEHNYKNKNP